ncbi:unnamed protein product [Trichogramma brassicae]|uniref:Uncharacterized protein n=1 Tax=Trichogramma brassicae TaxID=86971 RepID=A0A6H5IHL1_9HYME|nr:unnamed protein product [Trichogramma brassicae]
MQKKNEEAQNSAAIGLSFFFFFSKLSFSSIHIYTRAKGDYAVSYRFRSATSRRSAKRGAHTMSHVQRAGKVQNYTTCKREYIRDWDATRARSARTNCHCCCWREKDRHRRALRLSRRRRRRKIDIPRSVQLSGKFVKATDRNKSQSTKVTKTIRLRQAREKFWTITAVAHTLHENTRSLQRLSKRQMREKMTTDNCKYHELLRQFQNLATDFGTNSSDRCRATTCEIFATQTFVEIQWPVDQSVLGECLYDRLGSGLVQFVSLAFSRLDDGHRGKLSHLGRKFEWISFREVILENEAGKISAMIQKYVDDIGQEIRHGPLKRRARPNLSRASICTF